MHLDIQHHSASAKKNGTTGVGTQSRPIQQRQAKEVRPQRLCAAESETIILTRHVVYFERVLFAQTHILDAASVTALAKLLQVMGTSRASGNGSDKQGCRQLR
jgi:hypothetical protein